MNWNHRYRVREYLRSSLWLIPVFAVVLERLSWPVLRCVDQSLAWRGLDLGVNGAQSLCNSVITLNLSFLVFTFGSLLVAIQVASGQYTPRVIATTLLRDNVIRFTVCLFVFSFLYGVSALNRIEERVPQTVVFLAGCLGLASIAAFLFLIDYAARLLRPVSLVRRVGESGLEVLAHVYPEALREEGAVRRESIPCGPARKTVCHRGVSAVLVAVDLARLVNEAETVDGMIELVPQVGDFVGAGEPLFTRRPTGTTS